MMRIFAEMGHLGPYTHAKYEVEAAWGMAWELVDECNNRAWEQVFEKEGEIHGPPPP